MSLVPPPPQQGQFRAQGFIQWGLENLQGQKLPNLSGPPDAVPDCFRWEKGFLTSSLDFSCFNSCLLCLILPPCPTGKSATSSSCQRPFRYWRLLLGSSPELPLPHAEAKPSSYRPSRASAQALTI